MLSRLQFLSRRQEVVFGVSNSTSKLVTQSIRDKSLTLLFEGETGEVVKIYHNDNIIVVDPSTG